MPSNDVSLLAQFRFRLLAAVHTGKAYTHKGRGNNAVYTYGVTTKEEM